MAKASPAADLVPTSAVGPANQAQVTNGSRGGGGGSAIGVALLLACGVSAVAMVRIKRAGRVVHVTNVVPAPLSSAGVLGGPVPSPLHLAPTGELLSPAPQPGLQPLPVVQTMASTAYQRMEDERASHVHDRL